jgi:GTP-binding protein HflX
MHLGASDEVLEVVVPGSNGALLSWLHESCDVLSREARRDGSIELKLRVPSEKKARIIGQLRKNGIYV